MLIVDQLSHEDLIFWRADYVASHVAEGNTILEIFEGAHNQAVRVFKRIDPINQVLPLLFNNGHSLRH